MGKIYKQTTQLEAAICLGGGLQGRQPRFVVFVLERTKCKLTVEMCLGRFKAT
jgi:hypothetical protein